MLKYTTSQGSLAEQLIDLLICEKQLTTKDVESLISSTLVPVSKKKGFSEITKKRGRGSIIFSTLEGRGPSMNQEWWVVEFVKSRQFVHVKTKELMWSKPVFYMHHFTGTKRNWFKGEKIEGNNVDDARKVLVSFGRWLPRNKMKI